MRFFIVAAVWLVLAAATKAQNYVAGLEAYCAVDYATVLAARRPLA